MTTTSEKSNNRQNSETKIEVLYSKAQLTAYKVSIKQGRFIVMDYKDRLSKQPDTEIFWESGVIKILPHSNEYKIVDKIITNYVKTK
jgi:hypothetical protein